MRLAEMLRLYIAAFRLEQKQVASECGVSETTLSRFIDGQRLPRADAFARIQAWCLGKQQVGAEAHPNPLPDEDARLDRIEARVSELHTRTIGLVRLGGRR